jgi:hypothetical protein
MNSKKLYFILVSILVILGIGLILGAREANTLLESQSNRLVALKASDRVNGEKETQLTQDKKDIAKYSDLNTIAQSVVPQDKNQALAVREIADLAAQSGIKQLSSVAFAPSTLGGTTAVKTPAGLTQVTPVKDIPGVYDLEITITQSPTAEVSYGDFISFLKLIEQNRRTAEVSSINIQPNQSAPDQISFTLVIDEFIKP